MLGRSLPCNRVERTLHRNQWEEITANGDFRPLEGGLRPVRTRRAIAGLGSPAGARMRRDLDPERRVFERIPMTGPGADIDGPQSSYRSLVSPEEMRRLCQPVRKSVMPLRKSRARFTVFSMHTAAITPRCARKSVP